MKCLRRCLSLLLCFVLLSIGFSLSVSAKSNGLGYEDWEIEYDVIRTTNNDWNLQKSYSYSFIETAMPIESSTEYTTSGNYGIPPNLTNFYIETRLKVKHTESQPLGYKGKAITVTFNNIYVNVGVNHPNGFYYSRNSELVSIYADYKTEGGMYIDTNAVSFTSVGNGHYNISFTFVPEGDVLQYFIYTSESLSISNPVNSVIPITIYLGQYEDTYSKFEEASESLATSKGILATVRDVFNSIKELPGKIWSFISTGFTNVVNSVTNVFNSILELPGKIWGFIENGLKSLFVPTEEDIVKFKEYVLLMLQDRLGAVYQVEEILMEKWDEVMTSDTQNTISMPETTINLPNNNTFTFGGFDVVVVPDGFVWLADIIKGLVGIVSTVAFVNGMRHKYEEFSGVEK